MLKSIFISLLLCLLINSQLQAQPTFELAVDFEGGVEGATSLLAIDDGIILLGNGPGTGPFPNFGSIKIFKILPTGVIAWKKNYYQPYKTYYTGRPDNLKKIPWGGYVFAGNSIDTFGANHALLCAFDSNGDTLFLKEFPKNNTVRIGYSCYPMPDKGFVVTGLSNEIGTTVDRFWAMRVDSSLNVVWDTVYANTGITAGFAADYDSARNVLLLSGYSQGMPWLMEVDSIGHIIWQRKFISNAQCGTFARYTTDGGILFNSCLDTIIQNFTGGTFDQPDYIAKLDSNRNLEWRTFFPLATEIQAISAIRETNDGYLFAGLFYDASVPFFGNVGWVGKLDYAGQPKWHRFFQHVYQGYNSGGDLWGLDVTAGGDIVAAGTTFEETQDFWALKLDSMGCIIPGCDTLPCRYPPCEPIDTCPDPPCVGIREVGELKAKVYPNPTNGSFTVELPGIASGTFQLYNLLGQEVYTTAIIGGRTSLKIDFLSGIYIYRINFGGGSVIDKLLLE